MLSILLTNITLQARTGTEIATLELAQALRARGHDVAIYSPSLGQTALEARMLGVPVTDRIDRIGFAPDVIHGHHNVALAVAMVRFPDTPAIFVCHDTANPYDQALIDPRIRRYVAVDAAARDRLALDGAPPERIAVMANGVDLSRFALRAERPVPGRGLEPVRALLVVKQRVSQLALVEAACARAGVALEVVGPGVDRVVGDLPDRFAQADIVLAHSRSAIEAAATGAQVIIIDEFGYGGPFTRDDVTRFPETALSRRILRPLPDVDTLADAIAAFDPAAARATARALRDAVDLAAMAARWEALYATVLREHRDEARPVRSRWRRVAAAPRPDQAALAGFLAQFLPHVGRTTPAEDVEARHRRHGAAVDRALALLQATVAEPLAALPFRRGAAGHTLLDRGWYEPEDWGVWSAQETATLLLPESVLRGWGFGFRAMCSRYMSQAAPEPGDDGARVVEVLVDGVSLATWRFAHGRSEGPEDKTVLLPEAVRPAPGQAAVVTFRIERPVSPLSMGDNADPRRLGLRLTELLPPLAEGEAGRA